MNKQKTLYYEVLKIKTILGWVIVLPVAALMWYAFIVQVILGTPVGTKPAPNAALFVLVVIFGILFPIFLVMMKALKIALTQDELKLSFFPFYKRVIKPNEIVSIKSINIEPLADYGGWGVRTNFSSVGLVVKKGPGIKLELVNQKIVVFNTNNQEELLHRLEEWVQMS